MTRGGDGRLWLWPGNGPGGLLDPRVVATGTDRYDLLLGVGDLDRDGDPDLVGRAKESRRLYLLPQGCQLGVELVHLFLILFFCHWVLPPHDFL